MKSVYHRKKWFLFQQLEQLGRKMGDNPSKEDLEKKKTLLNKFNNYLRHHPESKMYSEINDEEVCQKCGGSSIGRIQANDEYYDICDDCGHEQHDYE